MQKTLHKENCKRVFSRYDNSCLRCKELIAGSKPRAGWGDLKKKQDEMRAMDIQRHFQNHNQTCDYVKRGVPCVAFDW
ncbi:hypothetical protein LCGC14_1514520 [marine sediment metagenome]|uniref:Uncharacterized protein n=1 Tax=marine sediment metagenome TaxID=412755 RepID=A0A0F9J0H9_9ZZZZ